MIKWGSTPINILILIENVVQCSVCLCVVCGVGDVFGNVNATTVELDHFQTPLTLYF